MWKKLYSQNEKLILEIRSPMIRIRLPKEIRAKINSYNKDLFWKPGTTHTPLYEGKCIQICIPLPFPYQVYVGSIGELPINEDKQVTEVIWDEFDAPLPIGISTQEIWHKFQRSRPSGNIWNHYRERRCYLFTKGNVEREICKLAM